MLQISLPLVSRLVIGTGLGLRVCGSLHGRWRVYGPLLVVPFPFMWRASICCEPSWLVLSFAFPSPLPGMRGACYGRLPVRASSALAWPAQTLEHKHRLRIGGTVVSEACTWRRAFDTRRSRLFLSLFSFSFPTRRHASL